jgi:replication-associated recombination protein RarA
MQHVPKNSFAYNHRMSNDLFDHAMHERLKSEAPLAARMRPRTLDEYIGQEHIVGEGKLLRRAIEADKLFSSIILWGSPGTGKTTLAQVIANTTRVTSLPSLRFSQAKRICGW